MGRFADVDRHLLPRARRRRCPSSPPRRRELCGLPRGRGHPRTPLRPRSRPRPGGRQLRRVDQADARSARTSGNRSGCTPTTPSGCSAGPPALASLVPDAAGHHERLDGSGYHRGDDRRRPTDDRAHPRRRRCLPHAHRDHDRTATRWHRPRPEPPSARPPRAGRPGRRRGRRPCSARPGSRSRGSPRPGRASPSARRRC